MKRRPGVKWSMLTITDPDGRVSLIVENGIQVFPPVRKKPTGRSAQALRSRKAPKSRKPTRGRKPKPPRKPGKRRRRS